jgi:hypothetical protein
MLVPWPRAGLSLQDVVSKERSASVAPALSRESTEVLPTSPAVPSQPLREEMRQQTEPAPPPPEPFGALARRGPIPVASSVHVKVTATLPAELYEQLQQEAQRRRVSMATIMREAAEAYAQAPARDN